jgi:hypothetical protein
MSQFSRSVLSATAQQRGFWRYAVSLLAALSFLLVVSASTTHIHKSTAALEDCVICAVVGDTLADVPTPPALVHAIQLAYFCIVAATLYVAAYATAQLLPPGRGPPRASA